MNHGEKFEVYLEKYRKEHPESHAFDELLQFKLSISELEDNYTFLNVEHNGEDSDEHNDSQEIQDFIRVQKSANTLKKTRTDLNILQVLRFYKWATRSA